MTFILLALLFGLAAGTLITWLILRERLSAKETNLNTALGNVETNIKRISDLQAEREALTQQLVATEVKLSEQQKAWQEKLEFKAVLENQFKNLANDILEDKSKRFTDLNQSNLDALLRPLGENIRDFKKRVEEIETNRTRDQGWLKGELELLRTLNQNIGEEANNLTNALKGQSKTLGNWGEFILEDILQKAGLVKDREYLIRETFIGEDGKRAQPDVVINLPDDRHVIIDSKTNLTAYNRYCSAEEKLEYEQELKKHIAAIRVHVKELDLRRYQDHHKLNSLDFVLMFIPLEPAFILAVRNDPNLFDDAFAKRVVVVCPSTLLATMRTVGNIWKQEYQKRNVLEIANQSGALYDKFVGFYEDLKQIGERLAQAQISYDAASSKLVSGKGNLVRRAEHILELGAKASKRLPQNVVAAAMNVDEDGEKISVTGLPFSEDRTAPPETNEHGNSRTARAGEK
ncbi:MAG TPA: DNA recombination protein RmuC [Pyrinomonadaceae bacterium]|jgi:DNA recombination protein RmuC|nr:DNA recombination protein RmuC [Pyrinomonadaceae bacterium]